VDDVREDALMSFRWKKLGLVFSPNGQFEWMQTHAQLPVPIHLYEDRYRVYFATRDRYQRSHIAWVEIDLTHPEIILSNCEDPVLAPGPLGYFDDHGIYPSSIVQHHGRLWMYTIGWNPGVVSPLFYASIGLAVSDDGGVSFQRVSHAPILSRSDYDPCLVTSPYVQIEGNTWRMWYVSGFRWEQTESGLKSYYHIKYAQSVDGIHWEREGKVAIDLRQGESNIARTCVLKVENGYEAWYSYQQGSGYRIGFATSEDGLDWNRQDEKSGIGVSTDGWDSEAIAYPYVFFHKGRRYMLYNGNRFGKDGFGLAVEEI
jgi:hypothetical protein